MKIPRSWVGSRKGGSALSEHRTHATVIDELIGAGLLQPRPRRTTALSITLMLCVIMQVVGLGGQGVVTWSLTDMSSMSTDFRKWLVIMSSFLLAIGSDIGTLPSTLEIFRKRRLGSTQWPDWVGFAVGIAASYVSTYNAQMYLAGFDVTQNVWRIRTLVSLTVLDMAFTLAESGDLRASFELQMRQWQKEYRQAVKQYYEMETRQAESQPEPQPETNGAGLCWCGKECRNRQHYAQHIGHDHRPEVLEFGSGVEAREAFKERYAETISGAAWDFPDLVWFNEVFRKEREQ